MKKAVLTILVVFLIFGCATAPPIKEEAPVVFYPALPQNPRLQFLRSISCEDDLGKTQSAFNEFVLGKAVSEKSIGKTYDIGSSSGKIYVMDRKVKKVIIIDLVNKSFDYIKSQRFGNLHNPSGIWVTKDDTKYVADMKRKQVVVFDSNNRFLRSYGNKGLFDRPVDVAVYGNNVYVCDMNKNRIFVLDKVTGKMKKSIGELGTDKGHFYKPTHVIVDHTGNIFVNDAFNFRIQKFDPQGRFVESFGNLGDGLGNFARPKGLDIDREGHLYVADAAFENVQIFDEKSAHLLLFFGGAGTAPGSMYLPAGLHIDYENVNYFKQYADKDFKLKYLLYVGNMFGPKKINVYGFGQWIGQPLMSTGTDEKSLEKTENTKSGGFPSVQQDKKMLASPKDEQNSLPIKESLPKPIEKEEKAETTATIPPAEIKKSASSSKAKLQETASKGPKIKLQPREENNKDVAKDLMRTLVMIKTIGNIRERPSLDAKIKFRLKKDDTVSVIVTRDDWYLIEFGAGRVGWAHQSLFRNSLNTSPQNQLKP